jgi:hypothetical protein
MNGMMGLAGTSRALPAFTVMGVPSAGTWILSYAMKLAAFVLFAVGRP